MITILHFLRRHVRLTGRFRSYGFHDTFGAFLLPPEGIDKRCPCTHCCELCVYTICETRACCGKALLLSMAEPQRQGRQAMDTSRLCGHTAGAALREITQTILILFCVYSSLGCSSVFRYRDFQTRVQPGTQGLQRPTRT